jgi:nitroreductase
MNIFPIIADVIHNRRSIKPVKMNGKKISDADVKEILELANWAPTHGRTEPWRFIVYSGQEVIAFCHEHAELYKRKTPAERFVQASYEKQCHNGDLASHIVVAVMRRGINEKIPALEEIAATAAAIQNILLGATGKGITSFWSTGGMTHQPAMKEYLQLREEDEVMGIIYLGYSDVKTEGKRGPFEEKMIWQ